MTTRLFVYGILKNALQHYVPDNLAPPPPQYAELPQHDLFDLGGIAGLCRGKRTVTGVLYEVDERVFERLDRLEAAYDRKRAAVLVPELGERVTAWAYYYRVHPNQQPPPLLNPGQFEKVTYARRW